MKTRISLITVVVLFSACDPHSAFMDCVYSYDINVTELHRSIKVNDTIWITNNLDAHFCNQSNIYKNGEGEESPYFYRIEKSTASLYYPIIIEYDNVTGNTYKVQNHNIPLKYTGDHYQSKYGIVFTEPGVFSMTHFGCRIMNGKDGFISTIGYFNVTDNNSDLLPSNVLSPESEPGSINKYRIYYFEVVE